jgi:elongation factor 1-gamma
MSLGTVIANRTRGLTVEAIVKHYDLDVTILRSYDDQPQFERAFPLKKVPVYIGPKGFKLQEAIAICLYCMYFLMCNLNDEKISFNIKQLSLS